MPCIFYRLYLYSNNTNIRKTYWSSDIVFSLPYFLESLHFSIILQIKHVLIKHILNLRNVSKIYNIEYSPINHRVEKYIYFWARVTQHTKDSLLNNSSFVLFQQNPSRPWRCRNVEILEDSVSTCHLLMRVEKPPSMGVVYQIQKCVWSTSSSNDCYWTKMIATIEDLKHLVNACATATK
jgi:hypothetical protein